MATLLDEARFWVTTLRAIAFLDELLCKRNSNKRINKRYNDEGSGYANLGFCCIDVRDYQVLCFEVSLYIAKAAGFKAGEGTTYSNLSNAYFKLRDP